MVRLVQLAQIVVVRLKRDDPRTVFLLGTRLAPNLFRFDTRDKAIAYAMAYAKSEQVRAWFAIDDTDFLLLSRFEMIKGKQDGPRESR